MQIKLAEGVTKMKNVTGWINMLNLGRYGTDYEARAGVAYMGLAPGSAGPMMIDSVVNMSIQALLIQLSRSPP